MKKVLLFIVSLLTVFGLFACEKTTELNQNVPTGGLKDDNYASLGDNSLTEKQLYSQMRTSGYQVFVNLMVQNLLDWNSELTNVDEIKELIDEACYGTTDLDSLNESTKEKALDKFVDTLALLNITASKDDIYNADVLSYYAKDLAQIKYARGLIKNADTKYYYGNEYQKENGEFLLDDNGNKISNSYYIDDKVLKTFYENKLHEEEVVQAIVLGFYTYNDAKNALLAAGATLNPDGTYTSDDVKALFEQMYENTYAYRPQTYELTHDDLHRYNSSFTSLIEKLKKDEYSNRILEFGDLKYLVYKLEDSDEKEFDELTQEEKNQLIDEKIEDLASDSFVTEAINYLLDHSTVTIYDPLYSALYKASHTAYTELEKSAWKDEYSTLVAKVNDKNITVSALFDELEGFIGVTTAANYFANKLLTAKVNDLSSDDVKACEDQIKANLESFEAGTLGSSYPSNLTTAQFKELYYGTSNDDEILNLVKIDKVRSNLKKEYPDAIFESLADFSEQYYENYFDLEITHLLLSVDYNMDGTLDDPELFMAKLDDDSKEDFKNKLVSISNAIIVEANYLVAQEYKDFKEALKYVAKEYAKGSNLLSNPAKTWDDYKGFNIAVKVEELGHVSSANASSYVKPFSLGVLDLYKKLANEYALDPELEDDYKYTPEGVNAIDELIQTTYGYHLLTSQGTKEMTSAKYTNDTNFSITWNGEDETLDAKNDNVWASENQIKIYMAQMIKDGDTDLPSSICTNIQYWYSRFTSRYQSTDFQNIYYAYKNIVPTISFNNDVNKVAFYRYLEISKRGFDSYDDYSTTANQVFAGWWEAFECKNNLK